MNAFDAVMRVNVIPMSVERPCEVPTNTEIRRWLDQGAVVINGIKPRAKDHVNFPLKQLIFFPKGKRKTTVI